MPARNTLGLSAHLAYEIEMTMAMHGLLTRAPEVPLGPMHNPVLESFGLHLRNLIEFFFDARKREDGAIAEDFFADPARWRGMAGSKPLELQSPQTKAHKQVAHLTYTRIAADKSWYVGNPTSHIHEVVWAFLDNADANRMGSELQRVKATLCR